MAQILVQSKTIKDTSLHVKLPLKRHAYGYPFLPFYCIWVYLILFHYNSIFGSIEAAYVSLIGVATIHALVFLICQWSISIKAKLTCKTVSDIKVADVIKVIPIANHGSGAFCDIKRSYVDSSDGKTEIIYFFFQKRKYIWDEEKKSFKKLDFICNNDVSIEHYKEKYGLVSEKEIQFVKQKYGENNFDIPIPPFMDLFKEHIVAPLFVFQIFCVALWFLDEMWYYSLFTLVMLFVFESTLVFQRLRNLKEMRSMVMTPYSINVYRKNKWVKVMTDQLLPGDLVSVVNPKNDEQQVPCDLLIINGSCIVNEAMLSGESTPQLKESIEVLDTDTIYNINKQKNNTLYGGTKVLQVVQPEKYPIEAPPDNGCLATVLRTGFGTSQGKLVRTIIYSTERVSANNWESYVFILILLVFAIFASAYLWIEGSKNELRKRNKLILDCILTLTSVVPPELPMELSLAVNNSLIALSKLFIFCTEPFRIPYAGKIDVCCFDKTGTLTKEDLIVEGISGIKNDSKEIKSVDASPEETNLVIAAGHSLVLVDKKVVGDPMEVAALKATKWTLDSNDIVIEKNVETKGKKRIIRINRRFAFSSALKRMSTIATLQDSNGASSIFVATKGAPEVLKPMFTSVPSYYDDLYKYWARNGSRVIALGYKKTNLNVSAIRNITRNEVECDLTFVGFLLFECPLKEDSAEAIDMLNNSSHRVVMITGDNALTACHVAKQVEIVKRPVLILDKHDNKLQWQNIDESLTIDMEPDSETIDSRIYEHDLCITGKALNEIKDKKCYKILLPRIWVYSRVSPVDKETIVLALKSKGFFTLMCGDGTNDVGALKQAHVGVALLNCTKEDLEKIQKRAMEERRLQLIKQQQELYAKWGVQPPPNAFGGNVNNQTMQQQKIQKMQKDLMDGLDEDVPVIKFGDASVASPFTSKISSVMSVVNIIKQGRCTLVATNQMYKILALNSLISAYSLSVLYLAGIKQGDWQATIAGFLITICFFGVAKSKPLDRLSKERPQTNIFSIYLMISIFGQVFVHLASLIYIRMEAIKYSEEMEEEIDLDSAFKPTLLNSAVYLISLMMQISTFAINYEGRPFREGIRENKPLFNSLLMVTAIAVAAGLELSPSLNEKMQLVPFPEEFKIKLVSTMAFDFFGAGFIEVVSKKLFCNDKPKKELLLE
ncbi:hypothetical protein BCR36DRAFT_373362 [Piromyces finnis]|uniref:Cation-transporting ATPase n=1 Tax=Piromyces finnis TaxID=1754191 RepID=A0A1Y1V015_9FUNG|nr:hypothetical protein BCR36DRAFT_373362 [Piromyces finnis]|eukprot:ORX44343.1 hypothetical protein BCR36DRAFT_373362 [Piromyces finnis]